MSIPEIGLGVVPTLVRVDSDIPMADQALEVEFQLERLRREGSVAAPGFMKPEGVVLFHARSQQVFKAFVDDTEKVHAWGQKPPVQRVDLAA